MSYDDPFAGGDKRPSVSFKNAPIGTSYRLTVQSLPKVVQARNFDTGEPDFWPDGNPKQTVVTEVATADGMELSLWAAKPSAMFAAIAAAQKKAGRTIAVGDTLVVTFTGEKANPEKPRLAPQKLYEVELLPGDAFAEPAPAPAAPAQPAALANPPQPNPVETAKQLIGLGVDNVAIQEATGLPETVIAALRNAA